MTRDDKSEALSLRYGRYVDSLNGRYITVEDVGTTVADMEHVRMETDHVTGIRWRLAVRATRAR